MSPRYFLAVVSLIGLSLSCGGDSPTRPSSAPAIPSSGSFAVVGAVSPVGLNGFIGRFDGGEVVGGGAGSHAIPGTPGTLTSSVSGNTVTISWATASGDPTTYVIEAGSSPGAANLANFATNSPATTFTGTAPNGTYFVRVKARNAAGTSPPSNEITVVVGPAPPPPCTTPPGAPTNFTASVTGNQVTLAWQAPAAASAPASAPTSYVLEAGSTSGASNLFNADVGNATSLTATAPNGTYFARARAKNACGTSGPSNEASFTVGGGGVNLSGVWTGTFTSSTGVPSGQVTVTFQHSGSRLTGPLTLLTTPGPFFGSFDLTQTAQSTTTRTFSGRVLQHNMGPCEPGNMPGSMVVDIVNNRMNGTFDGTDEDCRPSTGTFSLRKQL